MHRMSNATGNELTFSLIVPVHNEQEGLDGFYTRLKAAAAGLGEPYEILFVDDGSTDDTGLLLRGLAGADKNVKVIELSRNFGYQGAIAAGMDIASGRAIVTLDGDCEHPPELIGELVARWREGFEVVSTTGKPAAGAQKPKSPMSLSCRFVSLLTGCPGEKSDFRLLDRKAADAILQQRQTGLSVGKLVDMIGFRRTTVPYIAENRAAGKSRYTSKQLKAMASAEVFSLSLRPLRIAAVMGTLFMVAAMLYAITCLTLWRFGIVLSGYTHLAMFILAMFVLQFVLLWILGRHVRRTLDQLKRRPLYIVREKIGLSDEPESDKSTKSESEEPVQYRIFT